MSVIEGLRRRAMDSPGFVRWARRVLPRLDVRLHRWTGGRLTSSPGAGRTLLLTTTGRRSGEPRTTPLIYTRKQDGYLVVGSNWGAGGRPAWLLNLLAEPTATIEVDAARRPVVAHLLDEGERTAVWAELVRGWPLYGELAERAGGRPLPVVRLTPIRPAPD
ncbi:nitroreductase/quinone reductase family protein [Micromonospora sp. WMMD998]|uniref:nitroreductase/quinone reductase family protein n=1 Tax=Micromonospora sp. WMMD998 TaxID=3016092 RepID=UPI00249BC0E0|nr:nitroreductase/quinone reductase family protein [Micromonospora sp. WMMD998]WFE42350.1 nitroreductase family deazaflavin-dependent oxidoreductase [Micromonospora sp. WMMD998]